MYGFLLRPRWLAFHLVVAAAVVAMVNLGFWQLRRLDERQEFNRTVAERIDAPPVPLTDLLATPTFDPEALEWRLVTAVGTYLPDQVVVFNRSQGGRAGDDVLTALRLTGGAGDGTVVLVNRGFVALGDPVPAAPGGAVEVLGRLRPSERRGRGGLTDDASGPLTEVRRIEIDRLEPQFGGDLAPAYIELVVADPPVGAGDPVPVPPPELDEGPHLSYAFQWFIFSVAVAVGWVLAVRRSVSRRRAARSAGAGPPPGAADSPSSAATASPHPTP